MYCTATSSGPKTMIGRNKKKQQKTFFDRIVAKIHETYVLKIHVVIRLSINVTGYDKLGKSGGGRAGASFTTGRTRFPDVVLTSSERATASLPKLSLTTRARGSSLSGLWVPRSKRDLQFSIAWRTVRTTLSDDSKLARNLSATYSR